jgi:uncharacterized Zn finger protein
LIRRLQPGYNGGVGALHSHSKDERKVRFCSRCEDYGIQSVLKGRILGVGEARPSDYDLFVQCHNCGTVYSKHETRIEAEIGPIKDPMTGPKGKVQSVEKKPKQRIGRGSNPRLKGNKWEIKDSELASELKSGSVLLAYSSTDPTEPTI